MIRDSSEKSEQEEELLSRLLEIDDNLARLMSLCRLGTLAAEGMHGLRPSPDAVAFAFYFSLLRGEIRTLQRICGGEGEE